MATLDEKISLLEEFKDSLMARIDQVFVDHKEEILDFQKEQLFEGKDSDGNDLRPYYSEDLQSKGGFFKSAKTAAAYARWKQDIDTSRAGGNRNPDAPNLFINGRLVHSSLEVLVTDTLVAIVSNNPLAAKIMEKYGMDKFGLNEENWAVVRDNWIRDNLISSLRNGLE